ncbi:20331_t:CDS:2, partial [Rhizophagus irregularis]
MASSKISLRDCIQALSFMEEDTYFFLGFIILNNAVYHRHDELAYVIKWLSMANLCRQICEWGKANKNKRHVDIANHFNEVYPNLTIDRSTISKILLQ